MYDEIFSKSFIFNIYNYENCKHTDNRHGISEYYFAYMISGHCKITTSKETVEIKEGDIFFIPYGCKYQSFWQGDPKIKFISLRFLFMPNFSSKYYPVQVLPHNEQAVKIFYSLLENKMLEARDIGAFYTLVGILLPTMTSRTVSQTEEIVEVTKRYLQENPFAKISELAKNCAISESALYSAFKKSSEETINEARNKIIIKKADMMLTTTDLSIEEISRRLRFSSCSYFRKVYKKYCGIAPREIRKMHRI